MNGSGTRSSLMYETIRIVKKLKPKYVIWENVKNLISKKHIHNYRNYINTMLELGYNSYYQVLNSKDYGIPQNRERVFTISIRQDIDSGSFQFPKPIELKLKLKDMLEDNVSEKYYLDSQIVKCLLADEDIEQDLLKTLRNRNYLRSFGSKGKIQNNIADTLTSSMGTGGGNTPIIKIKNATKQGYLEAQERRWYRYIKSYEVPQGNGAKRYDTNTRY